jgi:hypothetical protein
MGVAGVGGTIKGANKLARRGAKGTVTGTAKAAKVCCKRNQRNI